MSRRVGDGKPVFTYFVQRGEDGPIKIGRAQNIPKRMKELATGCAEPLRLLAFLEGTHERRLHKKLHAHRMCGEWFAPVLEVRKEVEVAALASAKVKVDPPPEPKPRTWGRPPTRRDLVPKRVGPVPSRLYSDPNNWAHRLADRVIAEAMRGGAKKVSSAS